MDMIDGQSVRIEDIVARLKNGETLVYPTETCYGIGCDATNQTAVDRIFQIKQRQRDKPVLVLMADEAMAMEYVEWNPMIEGLALRYWPGPLTIVAPVKFDYTLARGVVGSRDMIAFRVTDHPLAHALAEGLGRPIVSTSANISAEESPYDIASICAMFDGQEYRPDSMIDAGTLPHHSPSTVVRVADGRLEILRQGEIVVRH